MIALLQRVHEASVAVDGARIASIGKGLLVFLAVEPGDSEVSAHRLIDRVLGYRVFDDADGRMNLSVADTRGEVLLVSQFTLAADTRRGLRPSFTSAAPADLGRCLFECAVIHARERLSGRVATGRFGADMQVGLVNDGPVTFLLRISGTAETG